MLSFAILSLAVSPARADFSSDVDPEIVQAVAGGSRVSCEEELAQADESLERCKVALVKKDVRIQRLTELVQETGKETRVVSTQLERAYDREAEARGPVISTELIAIGSFLLGALAMWTATR